MGRSRGAVPRALRRVETADRAVEPNEERSSCRRSCNWFGVTRSYGRRVASRRPSWSGSGKGLAET